MSDKDYSEPAPEPEPQPEKKPSTKARSKLTDKQKMDLKKHMDKVGKNMNTSEKRSHRMKMLSRVSKGMSISAAHKDIK
jgi:hypothetical protein